MAVYLFYSFITVTEWEKCAVRPELEPGTHSLKGQVLVWLSYLAAWHLISSMVTKSEQWHTPSQILNSSLNFTGNFTARRLLRLTKLVYTVPSWAPNVTGWEKCAVRPGLKPRTPRLQGMCSIDWAIQLSDTLLPLRWLSPYRDITLPYSNLAADDI